MAARFGVDAGLLGAPDGSCASGSSYPATGIREIIGKRLVERVT
jgi:hypothetical protein